MNPFQPPAELTRAVRRLRDAQHQRVHLSVGELTAIHTTLEQFRSYATGPIRRWLDEFRAAYIGTKSPSKYAAATDRLADRLRLPPRQSQPHGFVQLSLFDLALPPQRA